MHVPTWSQFCQFLPHSWILHALIIISSLDLTAFMAGRIKHKGIKATFGPIGEINVANSQTFAEHVQNVL
jgi:hypothetical protein